MGSCRPRTEIPRGRRQRRRATDFALCVPLWSHDIRVGPATLAADPQWRRPPRSGVIRCCLGSAGSESVSVFRVSGDERGITPLAAKRAFISFDFEHDEDLRNLLVGQAKNPDSPFSIQDWSLREPFVGNWKDKVRSRIRRTDVTIIICGEHTNSATGVSVEFDITLDEGNDVFLLHGRSKKTCQKPRSAATADIMYKWTWENLKRLIAGSR